MLCSLEHNTAEAEGLDKTQPDTATNIMRQYWTLIQMAARDDCCQRRGTKAQEHTSRRRQTELNLSLALLPLLLHGKLAVGDRCGKTFPPARTSYYVLADVSKSQVSFPPAPSSKVSSLKAMVQNYV